MLGYAFGLEFIAVEYGAQFSKIVNQSFGKNVSEFLDEHSEADQEHTKQMMDLLQYLSVDEVSVAIKWATKTFENYSAIYTEIMSQEVANAA